MSWRIRQSCQVCGRSFYYMNDSPPEHRICPFCATEKVVNKQSTDYWAEWEDHGGEA